MLKGHDISGWNKLIVPPGDFTIVKLTQGVDSVNTSAFDQIRSARHAGQLVGYYHYPDRRQHASREVNHFVKELEKYYLPGDTVWFDNEGRIKTVNYCNDWNQTFMSYLTKEGPCRPGVYSNLSWADTLSEGLAGFPWWKAWPKSYPSFSGHGVWDRAVLHQYSIDGGIDRDYFNGTPQDWHSLCAPNKKRDDDVYGGYVGPNSTRTISFPRGRLKALGLVVDLPVAQPVRIAVHHYDGHGEIETLNVGGPASTQDSWPKKTVYRFKEPEKVDWISITNRGNVEIGWDMS